MYRMIGTVLVFLLALSASAFAQMGIEDNPEKAVEQLMLLRIIEKADLDSYSTTEMLDGYKMYRNTLDDLEAQRETLVAEIKDALDAETSGSDIAGKMRSLMNVDRQIFQTKQGAVEEAATVLDGATAAQLYLIMSDMDEAVEQVAASLSGKSGASCGKVCPMCMACGASAASEPAPEEAIMQMVAELTGKMVAKDFEGALAAFSEDFSNYQFNNKAAFLAFLRQSESMGDLSNLEFDLDEVEVTVNGDKASVSPIPVSGAFGSADVSFELQKKDGGWKIVDMDLYGI